MKVPCVFLFIDLFKYILLIRTDTKGLGVVKPKQKLSPFF